MKPPWDKHYLKIVFHVIVTLIIVYILYLLVNFAMYVITDPGDVLSVVGGFFKKTLDVLSVPVIAFVIAYLFDPAVEFFQKWYDKLNDSKIRPFVRGFIKKDSRPRRFLRKLSEKRAEKREKRTYRRRTAGAVITYILILSVVGAGLAFVAGKIDSSAKGTLIEDLSAIITKTFNDFGEIYASFRLAVSESAVAEFAQGLIDSAMNYLAGFTRDLSNNILGVARSAGGVISDIALGLVVSFYFLLDKEFYIKKSNMLMDSFLPKRANRVIHIFVSDANEVFSGYIRGQLTDAVIMGVLISGALSVIGVRFSVVIGIISGLAQIIPYFGAFIAFIISVAVAFFSGEPHKALYAAVTIIILQQIDGMFIVPRVVGKKVELSPVLVLVSLSVGGALFGIMGMVFAVPVFAIIKILITRYIDRKLSRRGINEKEMVD